MLIDAPPQVENVFVPAVGDRDSDDLRQNSSALFPSESYVTFLRNSTITKLIGSEVCAPSGLHLGSYPELW